MGIYAELHSFGLVHRTCVGPLHADATSRTSYGYQLLVTSGCGAESRRLMTPADADKDLLWSAAKRRVHSIPRGGLPPALIEALGL